MPLGFIPQPIDATCRTIAQRCEGLCGQQCRGGSAVDQSRGARLFTAVYKDDAYGATPCFNTNGSSARRLDPRNSMPGPL